MCYRRNVDCPYQLLRLKRTYNRTATCVFLRGTDANILGILTDLFENDLVHRMLVKELNPEEKANEDSTLQNFVNVAYRALSADSYTVLKNIFADASTR